jgi:4-hydroxy-3-polyprenylbenzoate decarboxylase
MQYKNLREFITFLEQQKQLCRIQHPVSADLEITEITDRICKGPEENNKGLIFEKVNGSELPVLINAFGSAKRMAWALGVEHLDELNQKLSKIIDPHLPQGFVETLNRGRELFNVLRSIGIGPRKVQKAPVQQIIQDEDPSLDFLPILKCWPKDGGHYITLPQVITRDPKSGVRNVGMYRLQVVNDRKLLVHWQRHKGGAEHERIAQVKKDEAIPAAIVLGGDPASMWCASAPLPPDIDEYLLAGYLRGEPVPLYFTLPLSLIARNQYTQRQLLESLPWKMCGWVKPQNVFFCPSSGYFYPKS